MEASSSKLSRVDVGFAAGQVLSLRIRDDVYKALHSAIAGSDGRRWHEIQAEDSAVQIDLSQVVYVRLDTERERIGF